MNSSITQNDLLTVFPFNFCNSIGHHQVFVQWLGIIVWVWFVSMCVPLCFYTRSNWHNSAFQCSSLSFQLFCKLMSHQTIQNVSSSLTLFFTIWSATSPGFPTFHRNCFIAFERNSVCQHAGAAVSCKKKIPLLWFKNLNTIFTVQLLLLIRCLVFIFQEVPSESGSVCI